MRNVPIASSNLTMAFPAVFLILATLVIVCWSCSAGVCASRSVGSASGSGGM